MDSNALMQAVSDAVMGGFAGAGSGVGIGLASSPHGGTSGAIAGGAVGAIAGGLKSYLQAKRPRGGGPGAYQAASEPQPSPSRGSGSAIRAAYMRQVDWRLIAAGAGITALALGLASGQVRMAGEVVGGALWVLGVVVQLTRLFRHEL